MWSSGRGADRVRDWKPRATITAEMTARCASEKCEDESRKGNGELSERVHTGVVSCVDVEILI